MFSRFVATLINLFLSNNIYFRRNGARNRRKRYEELRDITSRRSLLWKKEFDGE